MQFLLLNNSRWKLQLTILVGRGMSDCVLYECRAFVVQFQMCFFLLLLWSVFYGVSSVYRIQVSRCLRDKIVKPSYSRAASTKPTVFVLHIGSKVQNLDMDRLIISDRHNVHNLKLLCESLLAYLPIHTRRWSR